jgi:hypothetical protein
MEKLSSAQLESLKKNSTERLMVKLVKLGEDEETVCQLDREALLEIMAKRIIAGKDKPVAIPPGGAREFPGCDPEVEKARLQIELQKSKQRAEQITQKAVELANQQQELKLRSEENATKAKIAADEHALKVAKEKRAADEVTFQKAESDRRAQQAADELALKIAESKRLAE